MGLGFSHGGAHWSYSGFNEFRRLLAREISLILEDMEGFHHYQHEDVNNLMTQMKISYAEAHSRLVSQEGPKKSWEEVLDPLKDLLYHSDCDGHLTPEQCKKIAPRLREVVNKWADDHIMGFHKRQALLLASGMDDCVRENKKLEFC